MAPHLLRCQGFAVDNYSFTLGRLEAGGTLDFRSIRVKVYFYKLAGSDL